MSLDREEGFVQLRSLEQALADLEADQKRRPNNLDLARMIAHAKAEIADRDINGRVGGSLMRASDIV